MTDYYYGPNGHSHTTNSDGRYSIVNINGHKNTNGHHSSSSSIANGNGNGYTPSCDKDHQEKEWDRDALLDPAWERQQKKTFTAWCNSHLRKVGTSISVIEEDFQSGLKLMLLLEVISGEPLPRPDKGRMRFHKIANVNKALQYIEQRGVKLVSIGAEEIVDGNTKITLGLIWTIILRFAIQEINVGELSARDGLLLWCQRKTSPYAPHVNILNFSTSWKDGLAFCALIHRHRPELIDYQGLVDRGDPMGSLNAAFDVAERHLDIPRMLEAEDVAHQVAENGRESLFSNQRRPDEKPILTYVSSYYHTFEGGGDDCLSGLVRSIHQQHPRKERSKLLVKDAVPDEKAVMTYVSSYYHYFIGLHKTEAAAACIKRMLEAKFEADQQQAHFTRLATDLLSWCRMKLSWLDERPSPTTLSSLTQLRGDLLLFQSKEKPPKYDHLLSLTDSDKDPPLLKEITSAWKNMEEGERALEEWLVLEIVRLKKMEHLAEKFQRKCASHREWFEGKKEMMVEIGDGGDLLRNVKILLKRHSLLEEDLSSHQERVEQIALLARELDTLQHPLSPQFNQQCSEICQGWEHLGHLATTHRSRLEHLLSVAEEVDALHFNLAKRSEAFKGWLGSVREDLQDRVIVGDVGEAEQLISAHERFKNTLSDAERGLKKIGEVKEQISGVLREYGVEKEQRNPYLLHAPVDLPAMEADWVDLIQRLVPERDQQLEEQRQIQLSIIRMEGELMEGVEKLKEGDDEGLEQLDVLQAKLKDHHLLCLSTCRVGNDLWDIKKDWAVAKWRKQRVSIPPPPPVKEDPPQAMDEYTSTFNHFDKDHLGSLDEDQLRACLISLGYELRHSSSSSDGGSSSGIGGSNGKGSGVGEEREAVRRIMVEIGTTSGGERVPLSSFLAFMSRKSSPGGEGGLDELVEAFRVLAGGQSSISEEELVGEMRGLSKEKVEYLIGKMKGVGGGGERLDYVSYCRGLYE